MSFPWSDLPADDPAWFKPGALHVPAGEGTALWVAGDIYSVKATGAQTNGGFGLIEATIPPGAGPSPHAHPHEEESFYLLSGELEFLDGDRTFTAATGDFVYVPRGVRHRFKNVGIHAARMLFMFTPPGVEQVIADYGLPAVPGQVSPPFGGPGDAERSAAMVENARAIDLPDL